MHPIRGLWQASAVLCYGDGPLLTDSAITDPRRGDVQRLARLHPRALPNMLNALLSWAF